MSCSALKRRYRDQLRAHCPRYPVPAPERDTRDHRGARQASRPGHFMPASLLASQFDTLEPLEEDEAGVVIDVGQSIDAIVDTYISLTGGGEHR